MLATIRVIFNVLRPVFMTKELCECGRSRLPSLDVIYRPQDKTAYDLSPNEFESLNWLKDYCFMLSF